MGGGESPPPSKEIVLVILPFPPKKEVLETITAKHPNVEIRYKDISAGPTAIPHGLCYPTFNQLWRGQERRVLILEIDLYQDVTILVTLRQLPKPEKAQNLKYVHIFSAGINQLEDTDIVCFLASLVFSCSFGFLFQ